jgi:hypothetical protein
MDNLMEYFPDELSVFNARPTMLSVSDSQIHELNPLNSLESSNVIEFLSQPYSNKLKDLSSIYLQLQIQLLKADGTAHSGDGQGRLANNIMSTLFESAYVSLNNTLVSAVDANLGFKEFWETSLNYGTETSAARLLSQGYNPEDDAEVLQELTKDSVVRELYGKINLCSLSKLLIPGVSFQLKLNRAMNPYYLIENPTTFSSPSIVKILSAKLFVRHVTIKDDLMEATERHLTKHNAIYEMKRGLVLSMNIPANTSNLNIPNVYHGAIPSLVGFTLVTNKAFTGSDRVVSPFNFNHNKLKTFTFTLNGDPRPLIPYTITNEAKNKSFARAFSSVYEALGLDEQDKSCAVTMDNFMTDHFMIFQDLTPYKTALTEVNNLSSSVTLGLTGTFSAASTEALTCLVYLLLPSKFEISHDRSVKVIY